MYDIVNEDEDTLWTHVQTTLKVCNEQIRDYASLKASAVAKHGLACLAYAHSLSQPIRPHGPDIQGAEKWIDRAYRLAGLLMSPTVKAEFERTTALQRDRWIMNFLKEKADVAQQTSVVPAQPDVPAFVPQVQPTNVTVPERNNTGAATHLKERPVQKAKGDWLLAIGQSYNFAIVDAQGKDEEVQRDGAIAIAALLEAIWSDPYSSKVPELIRNGGAIGNHSGLISDADWRQAKTREQKLSLLNEAANKVHY